MVDQQFAEYRQVVRDAVARPGDADSRHRAVSVVADRSGHRVQSDLELTERDSEALPADLLELFAEDGHVRDGVRSTTLERVGQGDRAFGVQHLAECRAVWRYLHVDPVDRAQQVRRVDLGNLY